MQSKRPVNQPVLPSPPTAHPQVSRSPNSRGFLSSVDLRELAAAGPGNAEEAGDGGGMGKFRPQLSKALSESVAVGVCLIAFGWGLIWAVVVAYRA